jgi:hypothetical protein
VYDRKLLSKLSKCPWKVIRNGCFLESGGFRMAPWPTLRDLGEAFRHAIFSMLKKEGKITDAVIENMLSWHHSGFHVHIGERIWKIDVSSKKWRKTTIESRWWRSLKFCRKPHFFTTRR